MRTIVTTVLFVILFSGLLPSFAIEEDSSTKRDDPIVTFVCTSPEVFQAANLESSTFGARLRQASGVGVWADRAVAVALDRDSAAEYLVPLTCGATGNCGWAVVDDDGTLLEGTLEGCVLFIINGDKDWNEIHSVVRYSISDGRYYAYEGTGNGYREKESGRLTSESALKAMRCLDDPDCCQGGQQSN